MEPDLLFAAWSSGVAAVTALVTRWSIVGSGFTRLGLGTALLLGVPAAAIGHSRWALVGCVLLAVSLGVWVAPRGFVLLGATAGGILLAVAALGDAPLLAVTAAIALGGVTGEMLLGHWYLVDPRLPRKSLRHLAVIGLTGLIIDPIVTWLHFGFAESGVEAAAWSLLAVASIVLMVGVWVALGERGYPAVMAATGLSYLAVLTTAGTVVLGRVAGAG